MGINMDSKKHSLTPNQQKFAIFGVLLFILSIYYLRSIYIPILISYFLAFLMNPVVGYAEKKGFGRVGPIVGLLVIFFAGFLVLTLLTLPRLMVQLRDLFDKFPTLIASITALLAPYSIRFLGYDMFTQWNELAHDLVPAISSIPATSILEGLLSGTARVFSTLLTISMIPLLTFYFLKDFKRLNAWLLEAVPRRYSKDVVEVAQRLSVVLGALIRGQFLVCAILAIFYSIALRAVGLDSFLVVGVFSGFMNLVPVIGPIFCMGIALVLMVINGGVFTQCVAIVGVYLVANLLDGTVLTPKVVGKQIGISPLVLILALLAGAELLGFLGILLALPVMAMVKVLGGYFAERYYASSYYKDQT
jgi:predicted PurR-regulated permease PerM